MSPRRKPVAPHATQSLIVSAGPVDPDWHPYLSNLEAISAWRARVVVVVVLAVVFGGRRIEAAQQADELFAEALAVLAGRRRTSLASCSAAGTAGNRGALGELAELLRQLSLHPGDLITELRERVVLDPGLGVLEAGRLADRIRVAGCPFEHVGRVGFRPGQEVGGVDGDRFARPLARPRRSRSWLRTRCGPR
jgi:hypothetical protein